MVVAVSCSLFSCSSVSSVFNKTPEERVKQLELGMSKKQVIEILGKSYTPMSLGGDASGGRVETLSVAIDDDWRYIIKLVDGRLDNWTRERIPNPYYRDTQR